MNSALIALGVFVVLMIIGGFSLIAFLERQEIRKSENQSKTFNR